MDSNEHCIVYIDTCYDDKDNYDDSKGKTSAPVFSWSAIIKNIKFNIIKNDPERDIIINV